MINISAIFTIIALKIKEIFQEYHYSILAPLITNLLFIIIFLTVENYYSLSINNYSFVQFIAPGLILMIVAQESYFNTSATLINMKQIGSLEDWLMAPIFRVEILFSLVCSSFSFFFSLFFISFFLSFFHSFFPSFLPSFLPSIHPS